jgi:U3 small nucleolar RNA-associated protein 10
MASSLAAQLSKIAANSVNSFNLKAQRTAHSQSLLFEPKVAVNQDFDALFTICNDGFEELCRLDSRFIDFHKSLFSEQSKDIDRTQMTAGENSELDNKVDDFLALVGSKLRLSPAIRAVEWLVRRFRLVASSSKMLAGC